MMNRPKGRPTSHRAALLRLGILVALLIAAGLVWWRFGPTDLESLRAFAREARSMRDRPWMTPSFVLLYVTASTLGLPITPLTLAAGVVFGAVRGALLSWTGAVVGAAGGFLVARRLGASAVRILAGRRAQKLEALSESTGFLALLRLQLIPVIPLSALNIACGVAGVAFWSYAGAAAVGLIPGSVIYAYFADQVVAGASGADARSQTHIIVASALLIALTFVPMAVGRLKRH
jgi:uncharacterized membrane protein YdjX (TVP38/TMEM64 family)